MAKKRGQNEGSIYQRKDGSWVAAMTVKDSLGRSKRVSRYRKTRTEARKALRELQRQAEEGVQLAAGDPTLSAYMTNWLESSVKPSVRFKTYTGYQSIVESRILPRLGKVKLSNLTPDKIQRLYSQLTGDGLSPRSVINTHRVLNRALGQALKWGMLARNPCAAVDPPRAPRSEMRTLTRSQAEQFMAYTEPDRYYALYVLAITTGMRLGELLGLRWSDIDFNRKRLHIQRALQRHTGRGFVFTEPKTARSRRTVMLSSRAISALRTHRTRQLEERLRLGDTWAMPELVFANETGGPVDAGWASHRFQVQLERAGLPVIRFHDLRHTAATLLLEAGTHPKVVSDMLGHSTISLTLDTYSHVIPAMHEEAAKKMDSLFGS